MNTYHIRIDAPFSDEEILRTFLNQKKNLYYVYGMETSKKSKKEHFYVTLKTAYHRDTITKKIKKAFGISNDRKHSTTEVKDTIKSIAYTIKDGEYNIHWDNNEEIDKAIGYKDTIQQEMTLKTLKQKVLYYLNNHKEKEYWHMNTDLMIVILNWFKEKELNYPAQHWLKNVMVTYWMQRPNHDYHQMNIETLYNIRNPFVKSE